MRPEPLDPALPAGCCSRREFLARAAAGGVSLTLVGASPAASAQSGHTGRTLRLATLGGDRATGYVMSNKIARRNGHLVCTWLDVTRQNRWALVNIGRGGILFTGAVDQPRKDNYCGAVQLTRLPKRLGHNPQRPSSAGLGFHKGVGAKRPGLLSCHEPAIET